MFDILEFNTILEMDFLGRYIAKIDNWKMKVHLSLDDDDEFNFGESYALIRYDDDQLCKGS